jgi:hypothetical protein
MMKRHCRAVSRHRPAQAQTPSIVLKVDLLFDAVVFAVTSFFNFFGSGRL